MSSYKIGTACRLTGIDPATLRNWEQRYRAIVPTRNEGRQRRYSDQDLEQLRFVKHWVDRGYSPSEAYALLRRHHVRSELVPLGDRERIRQNARRVRAVASATHERSAMEQAKSIAFMEQIARRATGEPALAWKLADPARECHRHALRIARNSTERPDDIGPGLHPGSD